MKQREIKFRVWCDEVKQMAYFGEPDIITNSPTTYLSFPLYGWNPGQYENDHYSHVLDTDSDYGKCPIVMQYTGLKDKDDSEIYEGDIVKYRITRSCWGPKDEIVTRVVEISDGVCNASTEWIEASEESGAEDVGVLVRWIEVIGNIYEQPELLTPNNQTT